MKEIVIHKSRLQFVVGDITAQDTDAVVNAANSRLAPGGGVAGAIHRAAGPGLWDECKALGGCPTGEARISGGHDLPNRYVIHTVGPVYSGTRSDAVLLKACYVNSLRLADKFHIRSVSFPALSTAYSAIPSKTRSPCPSPRSGITSRAIPLSRPCGWSSMTMRPTLPT